MAENRIEHLFRLQQEISALKSDPKVQELLNKGDSLRETVEDLGLTERSAAEMLVPQSLMETAGPLVTLEGRRRIPINPGKKMLLQSNLLAIRAEVNDLLDRLEKDREVQKRATLLEALKKLGISYSDAAEMLSPGITRSIPKASTKRNANAQREARFWKNPNTGEVVKARSTANGTLRRWVDEHGSDILKTWQIDQSEAPAELRD